MRSSLGPCGIPIGDVEILEIFGDSIAFTTQIGGSVTCFPAPTFTTEKIGRRVEARGEVSWPLRG